LALAEHMRASQVLQLLKMANSPIDGMCNIEENIIKFRGVIAHLRRCKGANTMGQYPSNKPIILYYVNKRAKEGIILSYYHISRQLSPFLDGYDGHF